MKQSFDQSWKEWIKLNIERGCDKDGIVQILLDNDFHPKLIMDEMDYKPSSIGIWNTINRKLNPSAVSVSTPTTQDDGINYQIIDAVNLSHAQRVDTDKAHLYLVDNFLSHDECDRVIQHIQKECRPSTVTGAKSIDTAFRSSQTCDLCYDPDAFIKDLDRRLAEYMGIEVERAEGIQGQFYQVGNQFKTHTDFFEPGSEEYTKYAMDLGQRTWTFMIYLNDVLEGGQTEFVDVGKAFKPKKGQAVIWNSVHANGDVNRQTTHWAKPIIQGEKYVITKWFRTFGTLKSKFIPFLHKQIPTFTQEGFKKTTLPDQLYHKIKSFYDEKRTDAKVENDHSVGTFIHSKTGQSPTKLLNLSDALRSEIFETIHPMLEEWSGQKLTPSAVYGIREYQEGASLDMHVDRYQTHLISMIINVDQEIETDWPLYIYDHYARIHKVILKPGEVVFYESAKLAHGRPDAFNGKRYANIFAHTHPLGWEEKASELTEKLNQNQLQQRMKFNVI